MDRGFDPYHKWLGIPAAERPAHFYRLLGVALFEGDAEAISAAADARIAQLRGYLTGPYSAMSQHLLVEIDQARGVLLHPQQRTAYDTALRQHLGAMQAAASMATPHGFAGPMRYAGPAAYANPFQNPAPGYAAPPGVASGSNIPLASGGRANAYAMPASMAAVATAKTVDLAPASAIATTTATATALPTPTKPAPVQPQRSAGDGIARPRPQPIIESPETADRGDTHELNVVGVDDKSAEGNSSDVPSRPTLAAAGRRGMPLIGIGLGGLTGLAIGYGVLVTMRSDLDFLHIFSSPPPVVEKHRPRPRKPLEPLPDEPVETAESAEPQQEASSLLAPPNDETSPIDNREAATNSAPPTENVAPAPRASFEGAQVKRSPQFGVDSRGPAKADEGATERSVPATRGSSETDNPLTRDLAPIDPADDDDEKMPSSDEDPSAPSSDSPAKE